MGGRVPFSPASFLPYGRGREKEIYTKCLIGRERERKGPREIGRAGLHSDRRTNAQSRIRWRPQRRRILPVGSTHRDDVDGDGAGAIARGTSCGPTGSVFPQEELLLASNISFSSSIHLLHIRLGYAPIISICGVRSAILMNLFGRGRIRMKKKTTTFYRRSNASPQSRLYYAVCRQEDAEGRQKYAHVWREGWVSVQGRRLLFKFL